MSDDLAHDAHLRAALRHAPDHALAPPAGLTQTILAAARQTPRAEQASGAAPPPMRMRVAGTPSLRTWLQRLMSPRFAGAWAAALLAALGLGLWLDLEPHPDAEPAKVAASDGRAAPAPGNTAESMLAGSATGTSSDSAQVAQAPARPAPAAPRDEDRLAMARGAAATANAAAAAKSRTARRAENAVARDAHGAVAAPSGPNGTDGPAAVPPAVATAVDPRTRQLAEARAPRELAAGTAKLRAEAAPAASPAQTLLLRAQGEQTAGTARWTWAAPGRPTIAPFDARAQAWLSQVVESTQGRWSEVDDNGESLDASEARWWRDGWPHATLRVESAGLRWIEPGGRIRYAPLDAATLQRLRSE